MKEEHESEKARSVTAGAVRCSAWLDVAGLQLVLGALDSLGVALADHHHTWTAGEREIYDQARAVLEGAISSGGCMEIGLSVSGRCPAQKPCSEQRPECGQVSGRSQASACSPWRAASLALLRQASMPCRCFVSIYSWFGSRFGLTKKRL